MRTRLFFDRTAIRLMIMLIIAVIFSVMTYAMPERYRLSSGTLYTNGHDRKIGVYTLAPGFELHVEPAGIPAALLDKLAGGQFDIYLERVK